MKSKPKKVFLIVGFSEGDWHIQRFEKALKLRGLAIARESNTADYIVAHSGGCFTIPPLRDNQVLMLINPTYWPGRSLNQRAQAMTLQLVKAVRPGNKPIYHVWKTLHNFWYLVRHFNLNLFMIRRAKQYNLEEAVHHHRTILVRNDYDPWLTHDMDYLARLHPTLQIARLQGEHDDCWLNPEPYIELLTNYSSDPQNR